ncbi:MAG: flagellar hook assembly protein FlgD [Zoogloeaceae bacterium]|jgi:flagellar basal-body rod modification protein FlgD|nr:flagellar hook assembly protein FlgD [Zoogloeaceae bacterium]
MAIDTDVIDNINNTGAKVAGQKKKSAVEEMSDRFMTLFMAQLKNQDPLNPLENTEMTGQLAQMNMVSGLENLNTSMQALLASYNEALSLQAANLIGKNVLAPGGKMLLTEEGALFGVELEGAADKVEIIIKDETGAEVSRQSLGAQNAGSLAFFWDGLDASGEKLPAGLYTFSAAATLDGGAVLNTPLQAGMVSALVRGQNGFMLEVTGIGNLALNDVRQVF